jgi:murein peptide amidase A
VLRLLLMLAALASPAHDRSVVAGASWHGRPIVAVERGDRAAPAVLIVGCIHGLETAGIAVVRRLRTMPLPPGSHLVLVPSVDPDGQVLGTRLDGRGVDLNRNFPAGWRAIGRRWSTQYSGPRPFSEPETRAVRRLVERFHPAVTIWYHQHMDLVWAWGPSRPAGRTYARAAGMRFRPQPWLAGTAPHWQNVALGERSFVVELPAGRLSRSAAARHAAAVLALAS